MRQLLILNQVGTVEEYTTKFDTLRHQILLAAPNTHEVLFVERYIAGLRSEIRSAVVLHRPEDVDTASSLALLQEVELENDKLQASLKNSPRYSSKHTAYTDKSKASAAPDDFRKMSEKLEALRAYPKSKNLCFTCGEPWARGHKCPDKVPIHVMEELLEVLHLEEAPDPQHLADSSSEEEVMVVTREVAAAVPARHRTMRMHGLIGKRDILILIDSGANCSFVDAALVEELHLTTQEMPPARYVVADSATLTSSRCVAQLAWWTQGFTFTHDVKVLPLGCYDLIVGADWLEDHSPMWVHWRKRWMRFTHQGRRVSLTGIQDNPVPCQPVTVRKLNALPVHYLQQMQQHKTCQPVVSADCALLANNPVMSLQSLQLSKLLVNEFEGSADCANQLVIPGDIHSTTVNSLSHEIFYIGKPPIRYSGFVMPLSEEQQVIPVKGTCASATVPVPTRNEGCEIKHGLVLLHYSTPKDKPLLSWDPGEHEIFVRFSDTSAATHRQKLLMLAGNWHFMNLEKFKGSGDYTYTGYQPQARRICSSYSLAGSLDRHMYCGIVLLDIFFQQFLASTYQVSTSQLMVCQHVQILVTNHCRSAPYFPRDSNKYSNYQILLPPSIIHCDAALVRSLYNLVVNPTHLILVWCASRLTQALHSLGNIFATYMRISAPVLLQAEKYFLLDFSLFFGSIVNLLYIATVEVSPNALHEHVQRGRIATYLPGKTPSSYIIVFQIALLGVKQLLKGWGMSGPSPCLEARRERST